MLGATHPDPTHVFSCPAGADRMAALRLLKQSMHTAIGSIVTMDAWQTPKGD